jgi:hypothetical protein
MFFGSLFIAVFFDGMNILAHRFTDIYLSVELIYMGLFMAFNMCILELLMHGPTDRKETVLLLLFLILSMITTIFLKEQYFIDDEQ